jgi:hypothetical protein
MRIDPNDLARLTAKAQKLFDPHEEPHVAIKPYCVGVFGSYDTSLLTIPNRPHALQALEAALDAYNGVPRIALTNVDASSVALLETLTAVEEWAVNRGPLFPGGRALTEILYGAEPEKVRPYSERLAAAKGGADATRR